MKPNSCAVEECGAPATARGWCNKHWKKWRQYGDPLATRKRGRPALNHGAGCSGVHDMSRPATERCPISNRRKAALQHIRELRKGKERKRQLIEQLTQELEKLRGIA